MPPEVEPKPAPLARACEPADLIVGLEDAHASTGSRQEIAGGEPGRSAAEDEHLLAYGGAGSTRGCARLGCECVVYAPTRAGRRFRLWLSHISPCSDPIAAAASAFTRG